MDDDDLTHHTNQDTDSGTYRPSGASSTLPPRSLQKIEKLFRESYVGTAVEIQRLQHQLDAANRKLAVVKQRKGALASAKLQLLAANQRLSEVNRLKPVVVLDLLQGMERVVSEADMDSGSFTRHAGDVEMRWCVKFSPLAQNIQGPFAKSLHHLAIRFFDGTLEAHPFQDCSVDELEAKVVGFRPGRYGSTFVEIPARNKQTPMITSLVFLLHNPSQEDYEDLVEQTGTGAGSFRRMSDYVDLRFSIGLAGICFDTNRIGTCLGMWGILPPVSQPSSLDGENDNDSYGECDNGDTDPLQIHIV